MNTPELSVSARLEVAKRYAQAYDAASRKQKTLILDQVVSITGWSRDHARRQLRAWLLPPDRPAGAPSVISDRRRANSGKYSSNAREILQRVWSVSGGLSGKYLAVAMADLLDAMESEGTLVSGDDCYDSGVRAELEAMSPATIDRYLASIRTGEPSRGRTVIKPICLLQNPIQGVRYDSRAEPGFFAVDVIAHCGPIPEGEYLRTLSFTDVVTGWVFTKAIRGNAPEQVWAVLDALVEQVPFMVTGIGCDSGSECASQDLIGWASQRDVLVFCSDEYQGDDETVVRSENDRVVRRYGFSCRHDTKAELDLMNRLWSLTGDRLNFLTPTRKAAGYCTNAAGHRRRVYDKPRTPLRRLLDAGVLSPAQERELADCKASLKPVALAAGINQVQQELAGLAGGETGRGCCLVSGVG